ncbi:hypothetical protein GP2143_16051 [marine gamma proteobacterium HTCC2143]|uniref:Uncharacterized protein n=1 Tax=marine gamma proteobacterium HTCC2143 TaxID=247633 RepID=A0Y9I0_9GAMM|nr:hypothetical protein GP2143_16051 [marine gamma proteobacterium HTCC2143]
MSIYSNAILGENIKIWKIVGQASKVLHKKKGHPSILGAGISSVVMLLGDYWK